MSHNEMRLSLQWHMADQVTRGRSCSFLADEHLEPLRTRRRTKEFKRPAMWRAGRHALF